MDDSARNVLLFTDGEEGSLSFIALDKKVKAFVKRKYKHMGKYFWTGTQQKIVQRTPKREQHSHSGAEYF